MCCVLPSYVPRRALLLWKPDVMCTFWLSRLETQAKIFPGRSCASLILLLAYPSTKHPTFCCPTIRSDGQFVVWLQLHRSKLRCVSVRGIYWIELLAVNPQVCWSSCEQTYAHLSLWPHNPRVGGVGAQKREPRCFSTRPAA